MKILRPNVLSAIGVVLLGLFGSSGASQAQDYPTGPIKFVVPFGPGGGADMTARIVADELLKRRGWSVVVDNKPGAATQIGSNIVARAKPDGYTVLWPASDGIEVTVATTKSIAYKMPEDFKFVTTLVSFPLLIGVRKDLPIRNMKELVAYAKANPGKLNYSSSGTGGGGHLYLADLSSRLGLDMTHIPFDSGAAASTAVAGSHADLTAGAPSSLQPYIDGDTIRPIAVSGKERSPIFPNVPTMAEEGFPEYSLDFFYGMLAPSGTPDPIVNKLRDAIAEIRSDPAVVKNLAAKGLSPMDYSNEKMREYVVGRINHWKSVVDRIGFTPN